MPISTAPYKRTYKHTKKRGLEVRLPCDYCGKLVPRYKLFVIRKSFNILNDPLLRKAVDPKRIHLFSKKIRICPSCARFRGIVQPGKSVRKKHLKIKR